MREFLETKMVEVEEISSSYAGDDGSDAILKGEDLRELISEVEAEAIKLGQPNIVETCRIRSGPICKSIATLVLSRCLANFHERPVRLMTVDDVAAMLQVSERTIHRMKSAGELPKHLEIGKSIRWTQGSIENFIKSKR